MQKSNQIVAESSNKQSKQTQNKNKSKQQKAIQRKINNIIWSYLNQQHDTNWDYNYPPQEAY